MAILPYFHKQCSKLSNLKRKERGINISSFINPMEAFCAKELFENETVRTYFISDILDIPLEHIKSTKIISPFLHKLQRDGKQGILDVKIELNNNTKINIEIQVVQYDFWNQRNMFYLSKIFTEDLRKGENYSKLKKCIGISILDYNYTEGTEYHSIYKFQNNSGKVFTDLFELHIIELKKVISGNQKADEWIRFFNIKKEEDLKMLQTKNPGIKEAIKELANVNLSDKMRARHDAKLKQKRDQWAREHYVMRQGVEQGIERGIEQGMEEGEEKFAILASKLMDSNRTEDLQRAIADKEFRNILYKEYQIRK